MNIYQDINVVKPNLFGQTRHHLLKYLAFLGIAYGIYQDNFVVTPSRQSRIRFNMLAMQLNDMYIKALFPIHLAIDIYRDSRFCMQIRTSIW